MIKLANFLHSLSMKLGYDESNITKIPITETEKINNKDLKQLLTPFTSNIWVSDNIFNTINTKNLKEFLFYNSVSERKYITEIHDCDDFSYELMGDVSTWHPGGAFGIVWGNRTMDDIGDAWNFFINENKEIMYVEPQTDEIFKPSIEKIWIMII